MFHYTLDYSIAQLQEDSSCLFVLSNLLTFRRSFHLILEYIVAHRSEKKYDTQNILKKKSEKT